MTHDSKELLVLADEYEAGTAKALATGYEEYGPEFQRKRKLVVDALRSAAAPQPGMRADKPSREDMIPKFDYCCHGIERMDCEQCSRALPAASPAEADYVPDDQVELGVGAYTKRRTAPPKPAPDAMRDAIRNAMNHLSRSGFTLRDNEAFEYLHNAVATTSVLSAPVPPPDGAADFPRFLGSSSENGSPRIARCVFAADLSNEDQRKIATALINRASPPSDDVRSALADKIRYLHGRKNLGPLYGDSAVTDDECATIIAALRSAPVSAPAQRWYLGAQNDGLFIINAEPRPSNDYPWHDNPNGPTEVLNVTDLPKHKAEKIVELLNRLTAPAVGVTREAIARSLAKNLWSGATFDDGTESERDAYLNAADAILALSPAPDATVSEPFESPEFNRGAREGWMRCGVYHIDIDFEGRASEQEAINRRWPLSSPQHIGREAAVSARDAVIEDLQRAQAWLDKIDGVSLPSRDVLIAWYAERPSLRSAIRSLTGAPVPPKQGNHDGRI